MGFEYNKGNNMITSLSKKYHSSGLIFFCQLKKRAFFSQAVVSFEQHCTPTHVYDKIKADYYIQ